MRGPLATVACAVALLAAAAAPALAARTPVVVQGTSDVADAGLLEDLIIPRFERENDKFDLRYIAVGSGRAMTAARAGQADAILVNAPSLEDRFVRDGFSEDRSGRAVFFNDHVLLGPADDPAGVGTLAKHDAARAFELIAAAGGAGRANFVSRGDDDGTNIAERDVWNLTNVPRNDRGEPGTGERDNPAWYHRAAAGQAATVLAGEKCEFSGGGCYVLTDRGTFNRLVKDGSLAKLRILSATNDADAPGGAGLLVNPYHVYITSARKVAGIETDGARAFVDFMTSRSFQSRVDDYPRKDQPPYFTADARPAFGLTAPAGARLPRRMDADESQLVTGTLSHLQPAFETLSGARLFVQRVAGADEFVQLADDRADRTGAYRLRIRPTRTGRYRLLFPGDFDLSPASRDLGRVRVHAVVNLKGAQARAGGVRLSGNAYPGRDRLHARLVVLGRRGGAGSYRRLDTIALGDTGTSFSTTVKLDTGSWQLRVRYEDRGAVDAALSQPRSVSVR